MPVILRTLIFTVVVPCSVTVYIPWWILSGRESALSPGFKPWRWLGLMPILLGALGYLWCAWDFAFSGRGTPAPIDPPRVLVARGLYRLVRNPMYVSVLLVLLGESLLFVSQGLLVYAASFWLLFHLFVLFYEEPALSAQFGAEYEKYCREVPRWLPRWKGWR